MESGIYMLTCKVNGHRYIGQSQNIVRRMSEHKSQSHNPKLPISRAIKKYGWENFTEEILEFCPIDKLNEREIFWIEQLKPEYNISKGGQSGMRGYQHTPETKQKLRAATLNQWQNRSPEDKAHVLEHCLTFRLKKGHEVSESVREKLRQANLGKKQSPSTKMKRSAEMKVKMLGNLNGNKKVRCVETGEIFESIKIAAQKVGVGSREISRVLKGYRNRKTAGGFHWEYHSSVETTRDECSEVGEKMSGSSKRTATEVEDIVHAAEMANRRAK